MQSESYMLLITNDKHTSHEVMNKFLRPILGLQRIPLVQAHLDQCN